MTFEQLEIFLAVAENNTFFDAAESLHTTQSTVSKQISKLESELGIQLLDRSKRRASLTEAGLIFLEDARQLNAGYCHMLSHMQRCRQNSRHELHLAALPVLPLYGLTEKLRQFQQSCPDITLCIEEAEEQFLLDGMEQGRYDLIIARENLTESNSYLSIPLTNDELMAIFPLGHPLATRESVSLSEIAKEQLILMNPYTSIYQLCQKEFARHNLTMRVLRTARVETILGAVSVHDGISLLAHQNFNIFQHEQIVAIPLNPPVYVPIVLMHKKGKPTEAAKKLVRFLTCPK